MRRWIGVCAVALAVSAFGATSALAVSMGPKAKGKKVGGDFAQAYQCGASATDPIDCEGTQLSPAAPKSTCTLDGGKFKVQTGKDMFVLLKGVDCGGASPSAVCVQVEGLSTIMDEDRDKDGNLTPETCTFQSIPLEGTSSYSNIFVGDVTCDAKGKCKGTIPSVSQDPCPDVDKVTEIRRVRVFDGPAASVFNPLPGVTIAICDESTGVKELARPGQMTQGL